MPKKKALSESDAAKQNFKFFKAWLTKNRNKIRAKPHKAVVYSGGKYDLKFVFDEEQDKRILKQTPMWKVIEKINKKQTRKKLPARFQSLENVLTSLKSHPKMIDRDQNEKHFAHAYEYMESLKDLPKLFPDVLRKKCWTELSGIYCENAEGDIRFYDGVTDDYKVVRKDKDFVKKELEVLLKNKKLSPESKAVLSKKIGKYLKQLDDNIRADIKTILREQDGVVKQVRQARALAKKHG